MAFSFCTNCGNKMTYTVSPPNFCGKCGNQLNASALQKVASRQREEQDFREEDLEEFSDSDEIPYLQSLAYDIEEESGNRSYQLGELFGQPKTFSRKSRPMSLGQLKDKHAKT